MRADALARLATALREPVRDFVRESRVRITLVITGSGQVVAQHGFARSYEVMNVASLAAAIHAASRALAELVSAPRWQHLHHAGHERQIFLAPLQLPEDELIVVAIFDTDSSLGMVQLFFQQLESDVQALPEFRAAREGSTQAEFERNLEAGLEFLAREP
jgi:predicted regulator of Ras-like GTPase activity (Roadblock/LC7/MglB family)